MRISVFGLGYVGAVSAACLARDGHTVVGCDIDPAKLALIREGRTPIIEAGMEELVSQAVRTGRLTVTGDSAEALRATEVSFLCVGTPSLTNGGQDLGAVRRLAEQLGQALVTKSDFHLFVVRSTVLPGTVEGTVRPLLETHSHKRVGAEFGLCFQPEFLREGSSIQDYDNPPFTVVGAGDARSAQLLQQIFGHLPGEFVITSVGTAEMLKYCCNAFHALKITFANEIGRICQPLGVDSREVMRLLCRDRQLNISPAYLKPGFAFGGSCLPKDVRALVHTARRNDVETPMLNGIMRSNSIHVEHAVRIVLETNARSVGMIGLAFKSGTDDLRESPLVTMVERFLGKGLDLRIYDPAVNIARLVGANRRYIEESIPHIASLMRSTCREVIQDSQVVVAGLRGRDWFEELYTHVRDDQLVLDLVNIPEQSRLRGRYYGLCW